MKHLFYLVPIVCILAFIVFSCRSRANDKFQNLSTNDFKHLIEKTNVQLVDVRTATEYNEGHIPESVNIDVLGKQFIDSATQLLDKSQPVAVYCRSGRRSRNAARQLTKKGYTVYNLDKGFEEWKEREEKP